MTKTPLKRPSIAAVLAATAAKDEKAIRALKPGQVWVRPLVIARDVRAVDETPWSVRIYIERDFGGLWQYILQQQNGGWTWDAMEVNGSRELKFVDDPAEIFPLFPFWAELAEREVKAIQTRHLKTVREGLEEDAEHGDRATRKQLEGAACNFCAWEAGAVYLGVEDSDSWDDVCLNCNRLGHIHPRSCWRWPSSSRGVK